MTYTKCVLSLSLSHRLVARYDWRTTFLCTIKSSSSTTCSIEIPALWTSSTANKLELMDRYKSKWGINLGRDYSLCFVWVFVYIVVYTACMHTVYIVYMYRYWGESILGFVIVKTATQRVLRLTVLIYRNTHTDKATSSERRLKRRVLCCVILLITWPLLHT